MNLTNISIKSVLVTLLSIVFLFATIAIGHFVMMLVNSKSISHQIWQLKNYSVEYEILNRQENTYEKDLTHNRKEYEKTKTILLQQSDNLFAGLSDAEKRSIIHILQSKTNLSNNDFSLLLSNLIDKEWHLAIDFIEKTILPFQKGNDIKTNFMISCIIIGIFLLYISRFFARDAIQTILGIIAGGLFIWWFIEYALIYTAQQLEIKRYGGSSPEYILIKHSFPFLIFVVVIFFFQENTRCNFILRIRRFMPIMRKNIVSGKVDNYAPRAAYEYIMITWFFYVLLMFAFDPAIFGDRSWFTYLIFFACIASTLYLIYKLLGYKAIGANLRYAIPTMIILWNDIEILSRWKFFEEPWINMNIPVMIMIGIGFIISGYFIVKDIKKVKSV